MRSDWYTLLSMGMRYWFAAIAAIIVFRAWRATVRDTRRARVLRSWAPDTGAIGEIVITTGGNGVRKGSRIPVPKEGLLGSSRRSDLRLRHPAVRRYHAHIEQRENGLLMETIGRAEIWLGGRTGKKILVRDGDRFEIGPLSMMLVLYSPGEDKEVDLDIAEDELFSPAGVHAADSRRAEKQRADRTSGKKHDSSPKIDIFMENSVPPKRADAKKPAAKTAAKKKSSKKIPDAGELFMPFDEGYEPFAAKKPAKTKAGLAKTAPAKKKRKKNDEVYWWQDEDR